jgi:hypothetical protein
MQCACAILSSVACPGLQYFFLHKRQDFRKKMLKNTKYLFRDSLECLSEIKNVYLSLRKVPVFLPDFNKTGIFSIDYQKIHKHQIS